MARPKKSNPKTRQFRLRMTEEDFQLLEVMAEESGATKTRVLMTSLYSLIYRFPDEEIHRINVKVALRMNRIKLQNRKDDVNPPKYTRYSKVTEDGTKSSDYGKKTNGSRRSMKTGATPGTP